MTLGLKTKVLEFLELGLGLGRLLLSRQVLRAKVFLLVFKEFLALIEEETAEVGLLGLGVAITVYEFLKKKKKKKKPLASSTRKEGTKMEEKRKVQWWIRFI